jgi:phage terminase large subunit-like protein
VRQPGEVLNPSRMSIAEVELMRARIAPHVFASQYQQRPATGGTGYCSIERLARYAEAPPFELIVHSWDIASTKGGGDWTVCAKFGLAKSSDGRDILYLTGIIRMQVELPDVGEAIAGLDTQEKPALIVLDGNGDRQGRPSGTGTEAIQARIARI